jgi:PhoH-like ATPase
MLTLEFKVYSEIIMTRVTVPVGEDIGFLPGTEEEKMNPWMGALEDNLDVLNKTDDDAGEWGPRGDARPDTLAHQGEEPQLHARPHVHQQVPDHRRGAEPDAEADEDDGHARRARHQGRLPRQHRANRHAVLTEGSSGITYVVDRFKGWAHSGHVTLQRGERSRLADHAAEIL